MAQSPSGYLDRKVAQSVEEAVSQFTADHIKQLTKSAIHKYIDSFMNTQGGNRELMKTFSKESLKYITDRSTDEQDKTLRKTQLAQMFENIRQELPCILIVDSSFQYLPMNWIGLDRIWRDGNDWFGNILISRNLSLTVAVGTRDSATCDMLHSMLSVLFGEMRFLSAGQRITGNYEIGETWVVKLGIPELGPVTRQNVPDDPKDSIWGFTIELPNVMFEDSMTVKQPMPKLREPDRGVLNEADLAAVPPVLYLQDEIPIDEKGHLLIDLFQPEFQRIIIKDPNIATIDPRSRLISPRKLGTTEVQVVRNRRENEKTANQTGSKDIVVASKVFKVIRP